MRTIDIEAPKSGAKFAVMYKMGVLPELFETKEKTLEVIERYPVLISQLDEEYLNDRETILTYVKSNLTFLEKYYSLKVELFEDHNVENEMRKIKRDANIITKVDFWFDFHPYDDELLTLLLDNRMWCCVHYTDSTYNEKQMLKALGKHSDLIYALFDYWSEKLSVDRKAATSAKERYNTSDDENYSYLALRKCMELVSKLDNQKEIYIRLFSYAFGYDYQARYMLTDAALSEAFRTMTSEMRYSIATDFYYALQYLKASEVDDNLAQRVIHECPIAANLLPDEHVLRNGLKVKVCDIKSSCAECDKCFIRRVSV